MGEGHDEQAVSVRAIVLPYVRRAGEGFTGAEVAFGSTVERFPIGRLVERVEPLEVKHGRQTVAVPMVREVTAADVAGVVGAIVALLRARGATTVAVVAHLGTGVEGDRSRLIASELRAACAACGLDVEAGNATTAPHVPAPATSRESAARPSPDVRPAPTSAAERTLTLPHVEPAPVAPPAPPIAPVPPGPRWAGIDPGARWIAVTIGAPGDDGAPLRYVASRAFEVGRAVPLAKPSTIKRADGSTYVRTHRREVTDANVEALLSAIVAFLHEHGVSRVAVERATHFHGGATADRARAASLARAQWIGGEIAGALRAAGVPTDAGVPRRLVERVETVSSAKWRALARKRGATWRDGVLASFTGWPTTAPDEHATDAAGVLAWLGAELAPKKARAPRRAPGEPAPKRDTHAARKRAQARKWEARRAAGCTCNGRSAHAAGCPLKGAAT